MIPKNHDTTTPKAYKTQSGYTFTGDRPFTQIAEQARKRGDKKEIDPREVFDAAFEKTKKMKQPSTQEEYWLKVRLLAKKWYKKMSIVPNAFPYLALVISGGLMVFDHFDNKWIVIFLVTGGYLYGREEKIEGYVDGWSQGQDVLKEHQDIDELLNFDGKRQKKTKRKK